MLIEISHERAELQKQHGVYEQAMTIAKQLSEKKPFPKLIAFY